MRDREPFYFLQTEEWRRFLPYSSIKRLPKLLSSSEIDAEALQRVLNELKEFQKENAPLELNADSFTQARFDALLQEAKACS